MTATDKQFSQALGKRLLDARLQAKLTMDDVTGKVGCSRSHVSQVERGHQQPTAGTLCQLAELYGLTLDWLCYGRAEPSGQSVATVGKESAA